MADIKNFSLAGIAGNVQFGKKGNKLISGESVLSFKNAAGLELINAEVADPVADQHAVTKGYLDDIVLEIQTDLGNLNSTRISDKKADYKAFVGTAEDGKDGKVVIGAQTGVGVDGKPTTSDVALFQSGAAANSGFVFDNSEAGVVQIGASAGDVDIRIAPSGNGKVEIGNSDSAVVVQAEEGQQLTLAGGDAVVGEGGAGGNLVLRPGAGDGEGTNGAISMLAGTGETLINLVGEAGNTSHIEVATGLGSAAIRTQGESENVDLVLAPKGTGKVDVSDSIISNVQNPVEAQDAATKSYVDALAVAGTTGAINTRFAEFTQTGGNIGAVISGTPRRVMVKITEAYEVGTEITIGTATTADLLVSAAEVDETFVGTFEINVTNLELLDTQLVATITGTSATGKVSVIVEYANK